MLCTTSQQLVDESDLINKKRQEENRSVILGLSLGEHSRLLTVMVELSLNLCVVLELQMVFADRDGTDLTGRITTTLVGSCFHHD